MNWYRPTATAHAYGTRQYSTWHAIRSSSAHGVVTHCGDRWPRDVIDSAHSDEVECEIATDPEGKCGVCADAVTFEALSAIAKAYAESERAIDRGLAELRSAPVVQTMTTREHGVLFEAFDTTDAERDA